MKLPPLCSTTDLVSVQISTERVLAALKERYLLKSRKKESNCLVGVIRTSTAPSGRSPGFVFVSLAVSGKGVPCEVRVKAYTYPAYFLILFLLFAMSLVCLVNTFRIHTPLWRGLLLSAMTAFDYFWILSQRKEGLCAIRTFLEKLSSEHADTEGYNLK